MKTRKRKYVLWTTLICLLVLGLWATISFFFYDGKSEGFAGAEALFSGLAFAVLIVALWMQSEELELQREELKATREELAGQKQQMEAQNRTLTLQRFENTFFQLLAFHNQIVAGIEAHSYGIALKGRAAIDALYGNLNAALANRAVAESLGGGLPLFLSSELVVGPYYRNLRTMISFVDESLSVNKVEKTTYFEIIRSQLSEREIVLFQYYIDEARDDKWLDLVRRTQFLSGFEIIPPLKSKGFA